MTSNASDVAGSEGNDAEEIALLQLIVASGARRRSDAALQSVPRSHSQLARSPRTRQPVCGKDLDVRCNVHAAPLLLRALDLVLQLLERRRRLRLRRCKTSLRHFFPTQLGPAP